ncbi:g5095 [Coccomyxa viridis]|uniref:G5095 protein n=1 Tax=Coccomyxa viridis TaxID=1274662 RepID=A0ABP1FUT7_9CHLO
MMRVFPLGSRLALVIVFSIFGIGRSLELYQFPPPPPMKPGWGSLPEVDSPQVVGLKKDIQRALDLSPEEALAAKAIFGLEPKPTFVGPYLYQGNLSIPVNSSAGSDQGSAPLTPLTEPDPFQVPPDIFKACNDLQDNNSTCLVVVQPYLKMVLRALSAGTSKYVQSAAPLPIEWRYMIELSVHSSAPLDVQPPWQLTIVSHLFRRVLAAYNSRIVSSNTTSGVTTFEVTDPRFVLEKRESSVVSILFLADARANEGKDATPQLAALNGRPCQLFFNSAAIESVATPGHSRSAADSKADQLNVSAESIESVQSSAASAIPSTAGAPQPARAAKVARPDQALTAAGASAPPSAAASAVAASPQSAAARAQPPAIAAARVPQPVGTIKVTHPDLATASSAPAGRPVMDSEGSLFGLADSPPTLVSYQRESPSPTQPAGSTLVASPDQTRAPSASAAAVSVPVASNVSSPDADPSPAASTEVLSLPDSSAASVASGSTRALLVSGASPPKQKQTAASKPAPSKTPKPPVATHKPAPASTPKPHPKPAPAKTPTAPPKKPPAPNTPPQLHQAFQPQDGARPISASAGQLYGTDGNPVVLKGLNWFGFETSATMVAGLWAGSSSLTQDFKTVVWRMRLLGFNAVRLPFSFKVLFNYGPNYISTYCSAVGTAYLAQSTTAPGFSTPSNNPPQPPQGTPRGTVSSSCNSDVPSQATYQRFLFVVRYLTANGFYVVLDNQFNADASAKQMTGQWLQWWRQVLSDVIADQHSRNQVMVDLLNEPDSQYWRWEDVGPVYLEAMDALHQISPTTLFLIEGTGQSWSGAMCWGDGFITDRKKIDASGMSDPNPFFLQLITKPYVYNVVIAPHYYPPSISHSTACYTGTCLYERMTLSFGYLNKMGYKGYVFPIVIGEAGSRYTDGNDISMLHDMAQYLNNQGAANDGKHNPIPHLFWWAWNSNSADTGGLVTEPNWDQIIWPKIKYLSSSIKLSPWYLQGRALAAIETTAGNTSAQVAASYTASFPANATLDGPSAMLQAFAADSATSTEAIATTAPAVPPGDQAKNYYPFLDFAWADCTVNVTLGPTHWSDNSTVRHGVLELVCTSSHNIVYTSKEIMSYEDGDIQVPYWLAIYSTHYGLAAMPLNWRPLWMGKGAITGVVEEV